MIFMEQLWTAQQVESLLDLWKRSEHGKKAIYIDIMPGPRFAACHRMLRFCGSPNIEYSSNGMFHVEYSMESIPDREPPR